jgi:hypothetical protein
MRCYPLIDCMKVANHLFYERVGGVCFFASDDNPLIVKEL